MKAQEIFEQIKTTIKENRGQLEGEWKGHPLYLGNPDVSIMPILAEMEMDFGERTIFIGVEGHFETGEFFHMEELNGYIVDNDDNNLIDEPIEFSQDDKEEIAALIDTIGG